MQYRSTSAGQGTAPLGHATSLGQATVQGKAAWDRIQIDTSSGTRAAVALVNRVNNVVSAPAWAQICLSKTQRPSIRVGDVVSGKVVFVNPKGAKVELIGHPGVIG